MNSSNSTRTAEGILTMLAAVAAFSVMDAALKRLVEFYPPLQVSCLRGLASVPFFLLGVAFAAQWRHLLPVRWSGHLLRGGLAIVMLLSFIYAVGKLPLGTAYGIFLCAPLLITALSALVLREQVGSHRWGAIVCGLIGVLVIVNPRHEGLVTLAGLAAFVSAFCYAVVALMIRRMARTESTLSMGLSFLVIVGVSTGLGAWPTWRALAPAHWPWIAALGASGAAGQYLIIHAFRCARASVIAPFEYTALLWGVGFDWVLWHTLPGARILTGAGIVIGSGLYLIYREHWAARKLEIPAPPH